MELKLMKSKHIRTDASWQMIAPNNVDMRSWGYFYRDYQDYRQNAKKKNTSSQIIIIV